MWKRSSTWPEEVDVSYSAAYSDASPSLVNRAMPTSESRDWFAAESPYFAPDGRTILQE